jgi:hypothetical protein
MKPSELATLRMNNQRLWGAPLSRPADVVRWFGAMQAQEFVPAKWALGQRTRGPSDDSVQKLYATGELLRTHVVRPTWHFVHRDDIRWLLDVTKARVHQLNGPYYRKLGVEGAPLKRCLALFRKALSGKNELTRKQLTSVLEKGGVGPTSGLQMGYTLMYAELEAVIVSGSIGGKAPTYASFDDRVPDRSSSPPRGLADLARLFFSSRGPATLKDFVGWSSSTVAQAKQGLADVAAELRTLVVEGRTYHLAAGGGDDAPPSPRIDLIQGYDEYVMSYRETKDLVRAPGLSYSAPVDLNVYLHAVMLDGLLIGHWKLVQSPDRVTAEVVLYRALTKKESVAMDDAASRLGRFFGVEGRWAARVASSA